MSVVAELSELRGVVMFDFDGVLVDSEPMFDEATRVAARSFGVVSREADLAITRGVRADDWMPLLSDRWGIPPSEFRARRAAALAELQRYGVPVMLGASSALHLVRSRGLGVAVVTSSPREEVHQSLERLNFLSSVDLLVASEDVTEGKPNPAPYLTAAVGMKVSVSRCVVIEDSAPGLTAANSAGMTAIAFRSGPACGGLSQHQTDDLLDAADTAARILLRAD